MIIVQEHRHPFRVAKIYSSPSLSFPKPAHFELHFIVQCRKKTFVYLQKHCVHRDAITKEQLQDLQPLQCMGGSPGDVSEEPVTLEKRKKGLENELWCRWSNGRVGEWVVTWVKRRKGWRMNCDGKVGEWAELIVIVIAELILQPFRHFTYVTVHSPTLLSFLLRHSSFSNPSFTSPMSQLILQTFRRFTHVTTHSPILPLIYLRHGSFSNPYFASPTSQALHLRHLKSHSWI